MGKNVLRLNRGYIANGLMKDVIGRRIAPEIGIYVARNGVESDGKSFIFTLCTSHLVLSEVLYKDVIAGHVQLG